MKIKCGLNCSSSCLISMMRLRSVNSLLCSISSSRWVTMLKVRSLFLELLYLLVTRFMKKEDDQGSIRQKRHLDKLSNITA